MKLLFLHSGLALTGSYTYAQALEQEWRGRHEVYWANDGLNVPESRGLVLPLRHKLFPHGVIHAFQIARYARRRGIQLLHAHSRSANLVAGIASRLAGIPYVTTAHMRTRPHYGNKIWPFWGDRAIAICESIADHLRTENGLPAERIALIRNGINLAEFQIRPPTPQPAEEGRWITVLGRLSGKRWEAAAWVLSLLPELLRNYPDLRVRYVGAVAAEHQAEMTHAVDRLNTGQPRPRVVATGQAADPRPFIQTSALVIAAGRSLMETMAMGIPTIAVGEQLSYGLMTPDTFSVAQRTNFGDFPYPGADGFSAPLVMRGISDVLDRRIDLAALSAWGRQRILDEYSVDHIARKIEAVYASVMPSHSP
jgi:glycosyltransferase involved in cell wall biosynthesis